MRLTHDAPWWSRFLPVAPASPMGWGFPDAGACCCGTTGQRIVVTHERFASAAPEFCARAFATTVVHGAWTNTSDSQFSDGVYAADQWEAMSGTSGDILDCTDFRFIVPGDATINGITVSIERKGNASGVLKDLTVQLIKGGTASGDNKASATTYTTSDVTATYGGASDLWSLTLTPDDVNASNFGLRFTPQTTAPSGTQTVSVDQIKIKVHFSCPNRHVSVYDGDFAWLWSYDLGQTGISQDWTPSPPLIDADGNVYVSYQGKTTDNTPPTLDKAQREVIKLDIDGNLVWTWNSGDFTFSTIGPPTRLEAMAFDADGNILVSHKLTTTGNYFLTCLDAADGSEVWRSAYDGTFPASRFTLAVATSTGIGIDSSGNIYIAVDNPSPAAQRIWKLDSSGAFVAESASTSIGAMTVDSVNDVIYAQAFVASGGGSATSNIVMRKRLCSDLSISWSKSFADIEPAVSGTTCASEGGTIGVNLDTGDVYGVAQFFNGSTLLANAFALDSSGGTEFTEPHLPFGSATNNTFYFCAVDQITYEVAIANATTNNSSRRVEKLDGTSGLSVDEGVILGTVAVCGVAIRTL